MTRRRAPAVLGAVVAAGLVVFAALGLALDDRRTLLPGDAAAAELAAELRLRPAQEAVAILTDLGSLPVTALLVALTALAVRRRGHPRGRAVALALGLAVTWVLVRLAKAAEARPRPPEPFTQTFGLSYPSGHAAYAVALVACALVLSGRPRSRLVAAAVLAALFVGASRVYLEVHYLSDVLGGFGLGAAAFALTGLVASLRHNARTQ